jgi:hypothetical protein
LRGDIQDNVDNAINQQSVDQPDVESISDTPQPQVRQESERRYGTMQLRSLKPKQSFNISVKQALKNMPVEARASMHKEMKQLHDKDVFDPVPPSVKPSKKVIKSFMFLKDKYLSDGSFDKLKSRLVAGGHMQDRSNILYEDITSPTANLSNLMVIATVAAKESRKIRTADISGAYLNADMKSAGVFIELDEVLSDILVSIDPSYSKFIRKNGKMVVELKKALYGCIESAKLWYDLLSQTLIRDGYTMNPLDKCVFNKTIDGVQITVVIYVDDLFMASVSDFLLDKLVDLLRLNFKDITVNTGLIHSYLGMTWDFTTPFSVKVTMEGYAKDLLAFSEVTGDVKTPATDQLFAVRESFSPLSDVDKARFHTLVAKLL